MKKIILLLTVFASFTFAASAQEIADNRQLRCFNSTYGKLSLDRIGPRAEVRFPGALPSGRARVNCTMPGPDGRWRWFGKQLLVP